MFFTDNKKQKSTDKKMLIWTVLFLLLASCSGGGEEGGKKSEVAKKSAAGMVANKKDMISKTIEHLISIQNRINSFKQKHGTLPDFDELGSNYDMWKGRIEFSTLKNNRDYDYMLQSKGPDGRKNTDDDLRIINSTTDHPLKKRSVRENSSTENLEERLGTGDAPSVMSMDDLPTEGLDDGGMELSIEDFQKMAGENTE